MNFLKKQQGFTLIEILAVTIISALVSTLIIGILISSSNTNAKQVKANKNLTDASYVLKVITKDVRKSTKLESVDHTYTFTNDSSSTETFIYTFDEGTGTLTRNQEVLAVGLKRFELAGANSVSLLIETESQQPKFTKLNFRSGD